MYETTPWQSPPGRQRPATTPVPTTSSSPIHPGGVNVLMGDGSVRFLRDTVNIVTLRSLVTLKGGEVISADSY